MESSFIMHDLTSVLGVLVRIPVYDLTSVCGVLVRNA